MDEQPSSELGTKSYWDSTYSKELTNFNDIDDVGEIWFGEDSEMRIFDWIVNWATANAKEECSVQANEGFKQLCGIDYSEAAVQLGKAVAKKSETEVDFFHANILKTEECSGSIFKTKYRICHDKGTYDAISLTPNTAKQDRLTYMDSVASLLDSNSVFIITSCNWTEDELLTQFENHFKKLEAIPTPTFQFGGKIGSMVTSLVLQKITADKL